MGIFLGGGIECVVEGAFGRMGICVKIEIEKMIVSFWYGMYGSGKRHMR